MNKEKYRLPFGEVSDDDLMKWQLVRDSMVPILSHYQDSDVSDILINRYDCIFVSKNGKYELTDSKFASENDLSTFLEQLAIALEQKVDGVLDARFPDCSRACFTTKEVTPHGITASIRINRINMLELHDLVNSGALNEEMADFLIEKVKQRANMMVSGGTGSGKTTLLRALSKFVDVNERVLIAEDTQELHLDWFPNKVAMESPNREGTRVDLPFLIKTTLRQNGDRAWVGEIRDAASADAFLLCINSGTNGVYATIHANSPDLCVKRMQYLLSSQGYLSYELAGKTVLNSVDVIIQATRSPVFGRKITNIAVSNGEKLITLFRYNELLNLHERVESI